MPSGPTPFQARFVTATQQLLALAVVCAALTPAAGVVSLDVVAEAPEGSGGDAASALLSAHGEEGLARLTQPTGAAAARSARTASAPVGVLWAHGVESPTRT